MQTQVYVRPLDYQGRISIPSKIRKELNLEPEDKLKISLIDREIKILPEPHRCVICGNIAENIYKKQFICDNCVAGLTQSNDIDRSGS